MDIAHFRLIDEVIAVSADLAEISCRANVPFSSPLFAGHFPGDPLLPGVLSIETMAQAAGFLAMLNGGLKKMGYLMAVENARFRVAIRPGTQLTAKARSTHWGSGYAAFECALEVESRQVASASIRIKLSEFGNDVLREAMLERVNRLELKSKIGSSYGA